MHLIAHKINKVLYQSYAKLINTTNIILVNINILLLCIQIPVSMGCCSAAASSVLLSGCNNAYSNT